VTIEFLFVPLDEQGVFSFLFRWQGPFPRLVDWSYWFWGTEVGGEISEDTIWPLDGSPYYVTSDVSVQPEVTLTIEPGVAVRFKKFSDFSGIKVGLSVHGNLLAEGTEASRIVFTTSCDFEGSDQTQGEWSEELQDYFGTDWEGIHIGGGNVNFNYCDVEYARANIQAGNASLEVYNSRIKGGEYGISAHYSSAIIAKNTIERNGFVAINLGQGTTATTVAENTITVRRGHGAMHLMGEGEAEIIKNNTISLESPSEEVPEPFAFWGINCKVNFIADISGDNDIELGIGVGEGATAAIKGNIIHDRGISVEQGGTATIMKNTITNCDTGVYNGIGGFSVINDNNISGNSSWGVYNEDCNITIDAENNWWGHESGPYHSETNPDGKGDRVSDCVDFDPWLPVPVGLLWAAAPLSDVIGRNYPNPFNPETWIPYHLAEEKSNVTIRIYNTSGQLVHTLSLGAKRAGAYLTKEKAAYWDGRNNRGEHVVSGVYFYTLQAENFTATRKMLLVK